MTSETSLSRALRILDSFGSAGSTLTLAEIVEATGLPAATAHRYLAQLVAWGGVERSARGTYALGRRMWRLGSTAPRERALRDLALPVMEGLLEAAREVVHLAVLDGTQALYVEKLVPRRPTSVRSTVGMRLPLHASGPGKCLLAHGGEEMLRSVIEAGMPRVASRTITDPAALREALAAIRRTGSVISRDEMTDGLSSAAAPIFDRQRQAVAALAVVMPTERPGIQAVEDAVRSSARRISILLQQHR